MFKEYTDLQLRSLLADVQAEYFHRREEKRKFYLESLDRIVKAIQDDGFELTSHDFIIENCTDFDISEAD